MRWARISAVACGIAVVTLLLAPTVGATVFLLAPPTPAPKIVDGEYVVRDEPPRGVAQATADAAGRVVMETVRPGEYLVVARVEGYVSPEEYPAPWGAGASGCGWAGGAAGVCADSAG